MHPFPINTIQRNLVRRLLPILLAGVLSVVLCGTALAVSLRVKLEMLGYKEDEIAAILSGREHRRNIDRKIRREMLCLAVDEPSLPPDGNTGQLDTSKPIAAAVMEGKKRKLPVPDKPPENAETNPFEKAGHELHIEEQTLSGRFNHHHDTIWPHLLEKAKPYLPIIRNVARKTRIDESLIMAVIKVESDFEPKAISPKGAMGLMQLAPSTAKSLGVSDPFDPNENIHGGAEYLSYCINTFQDMELALAAYNAGPHLVGQLKKIPPYPETRSFVKDVIYHRKIYDQLLVRPL
ncbi:MAG: lytic transglycosylase domain-containing protein [Deltaproteobacteria bacterium]|nr:lytic transglycosylase domain-containing protein [Deltaproteobacteria bacterium]